MPRGYGRLTRGGQGFYAHRYALEVKLGRDLLPGEFACHTCDNPPCVNPDHLFVGDQSLNMKDASRKGRVRNQWGACLPQGDNHMPFPKKKTPAEKKAEAAKADPKAKAAAEKKKPFPKKKK